ncbi:hypothetical protein NX059_001007 [Plenodomus lindquistii]|nr:hypothetical protein NX059_001007 [Plenodomus lindquistii]
MTRAAPSLPQVKIPAPEQIALAVAVIRSKPATLSLRNYILQLRKHVRRGANPATREDSSHYLDLVGYWKDKYARSQEECARLQSLNIKLERSNHALTVRLDLPIDGLDQRVGPSPRRKARAASPVRITKRSQPTSAQQSVVETQDSIEDDADFLDALGDDGANLTEALFILHSLCRASRSDPDTLCLTLVKTTSTLGKVIRVVAQNYKSLSRHGRGNSEAMSLDQDKSDFSIALSVCARAFMSVLIGISKLMGSDADTRRPSLVICELVDMFKCAMNAIQLSARQTAELVTSQPIQVKKSKPETADQRPRESAAARAIAHLLVGFLGLLDKSDDCHQKLFDGFVFILLERVGQRLYYCTFGHHRSTSIEGNIMSPPASEGSSEIPKDDSAAPAVRLELKALILILERAMGLAPYHMNPQIGRTSKFPNHLLRTLSTKTLPTASRARLSPIAKEKLQRTLLACMYGDEVQDDFLDVLTKPLPAMRLASLQNVAKVDDKEVTTWFKQEVWRLVGWDVMGKEGGWH